MKDLVKNPIGIIALFISLIYAFANLLLGATASTLSHEERIPLIAFIVMFPVVVLGIFYLLVTRHHGKLYAPGDYKDDKSFLRTLSQEERERKLDKETQEVQEAQEIEAKKSLSAPNERNAPDFHQQPSQQSPSDIRNELQLVETLTIAKFEAEFNQRAERDVGVGNSGANFDAFFAVNEKFTFVEVKIVRHIAAFNMMLDRILYNAVLADRYLDSKFKLILAVVHNFGEPELQRINNIWRKRLENCPATVELRLISRNELGA